MKFLEKCKDGGPESPVDAYFLLEIKGLCSIGLLKFNKGRREKFHTHAFNALTWFLKGNLEEERIYELQGELWNQYTPYKKSIFPKVTKKHNLHRVKAREDSWCLTLRGRWQDTWTEYSKQSGKTTTLTHGRKIVV